MGELNPTLRTTAFVHGITIADSTASRYFRVTFHPDAADLQAAARRTNPTMDWDDVAGCFHTSGFRSRYDRKTKTWVDSTSPSLGHMRLHYGALTTDVVTHECTHAALHAWRRHQWAQPGMDSVADFGDGVDQREEDFALILGQITHVVTGMVARLQERLRATPEAASPPGPAPARPASRTRASAGSPRTLISPPPPTP